MDEKLESVLINFSIVTYGVLSIVLTIIIILVNETLNVEQWGIRLLILLLFLFTAHAFWLVWVYKKTEAKRMTHNNNSKGMDLFEFEENLRKLIKGSNRNTACGNCKHYKPMPLTNRNAGTCALNDAKVKILHHCREWKDGRKPNGVD